MTDRFVCSDASVERGEAVTATASQVRGWLLVEVLGAGGIDAIAESELGAFVPDGWKADLKRRGIRPICVRRPVRGSRDGPRRLFFVTCARPGHRAGSVWTRQVTSLAEVAGLTDALRLGVAPDGWEPHPERLVAVCTNGKHDQCCANRGRPIARHLAAGRRASEVWECSHIGGDRFAANVLVLPDGLYFGRMDPDGVDRILDEPDAGRIDLAHYRGRSTMSFEQQAAEFEIRRSLDVRGLDDVVIQRTDDGRRVQADVAEHGRIEVQMARTVEHPEDPLTCRGPDGQRVPVHTVVSIRSPGP